MSFAGCQVNPIDVNFKLQKSLETFDNNSSDKIWSKNHKEIKLLTLMPIRIKQMQFAYFGYQLKKGI